MSIGYSRPRLHFTSSHKRNAAGERERRGKSLNYSIDTTNEATYSDGQSLGQIAGQAFAALWCRPAAVCGAHPADLDALLLPGNRGGGQGGRGRHGNAVGKGEDGGDDCGTHIQVVSYRR